MHLETLANCERSETILVDRLRCAFNWKKKSAAITFRFPLVDASRGGRKSICRRGFVIQFPLAWMLARDGKNDQTEEQNRGRPTRTDEKDEEERTESGEKGRKKQSKQKERRRNFFIYIKREKEKKEEKNESEESEERMKERKLEGEKDMQQKERERERERKLETKENVERKPEGEENKKGPFLLKTLAATFRGSPLQKNIKPPSFSP